MRQNKGEAGFLMTQHDAESTHFQTGVIYERKNGENTRCLYGLSVLSMCAVGESERRGRMLVLKAKTGVKNIIKTHILLFKHVKT